MHIPILSIMLLIPVIGAFFICFTSKDDQENPKILALLITVINFIISCCIAYKFDLHKTGYQFLEKYLWIDKFNISYHLGVDGIAVLFMLLTTLLIPIAILISWNTIKIRLKAYMICLLIIESCILGSFFAVDLLLFFIFFESVLIPMFFVIGIWGGNNKIYASFKFFLFTLAGSVILLLALLKIANDAGSTNLLLIKNMVWIKETQIWLFAACLIAFAIKVPMCPLHTWLPDAHVEAPTGGSVILAGILLKLGGYGLWRIAIPLLPEGYNFFIPTIIILSLVAIIYAALTALVQTDIKKLIAYSSISHMGMVTLGLTVTKNSYGIAGSIVQMISHGLVSAALFCCVGIVYDRFHTREISNYGGLAKVMPIYSSFFMIFTLSAIAFPGTSSFVGELLIFLGFYQQYHNYTIIAVLGVILSAAYSLILYRRVFFGKVSKNLGLVAPETTTQNLHYRLDLNGLEILILSILTIAIFYIGFCPNNLLKFIAYK